MELHTLDIAHGHFNSYTARSGHALWSNTGRYICMHDFLACCFACMIFWLAVLYALVVYVYAGLEQRGKNGSSVATSLFSHLSKYYSM